MQRASQYSTLLVLTVLVTSCAGTTRTHEDIHSTIDAINKQQAAMIGRGDAAGIAALYSSNAQLRPPNGELVTGQAAIQKWWQSSLAGGPSTATITSQEIESCGDTAWDVGSYTITGADGKLLDKGKYTTIWKRENAQWKLHRDIFNSDLPAGG
jgi:ketosteroid isomerase-like protein